MNEVSKDFGIWIRDKRLARGWSQERLGGKVGIHGNSIHRYETCCQFPPLDVAEAIINVLDGELVLNDEKS